jgi:hypothetical protein
MGSPVIGAYLVGIKFLVRGVPVGEGNPFGPVDKIL